MAADVGIERLAGVDVFADLSPDELERVCQKMRLKHAPVGAVITAEGDFSTAFYVLLRGTVTVHRDGRHISDLGRGDVFGELGTVTLQPRNATVIVTTPAELAVLMGWDLRELTDEHPSVTGRLEAIAASRSSSPPTSPSS